MAASRTLSPVAHLLLAMAFASAPAAAQEAPTGAAVAPGPAWPDAVADARGMVVDRMAELGIPGLSVAVHVDGRLVWSEGFGFADVENRVPVWPSTRFRTASISKALTSAAVGHLLEVDSLDLDVPVQRYVPSFPEKRWPVTTRQLAGHLAGIRHYRGEEFGSAVRYGDVVDALVIFRGDSLIHEPGTRYSYSTYGWNLVSAVVQGASGTPFLPYMTQIVFEPLEMRSTVAEHLDSIIPHRARFYQRGEDGRLVNAPHVDNSNKWAGGGFLSTAEDLVRFGSGLLRGELLDPETVDLLFTSQRTSDAQPTDYGIGWRTERTPERRVVYHTGGAMGGSTILLLYPEEQVVVAILTNLQSVRHVDTARALADRFLAAASPAHVGGR